VRDLRDYVQSVHDRYGLPIWVTEFALIDFAGDSPDPVHATYPADADQAQFIMNSTAMLESLPFVERYAWFALPTQANVPGSGLCREDGTLTAAGQAYRRAGVEGAREDQ
jgi:putative glycosyl hydrolase